MNIRKAIVYGAAGLSLLAAVAHAAVTPEHMEEWWGYGAFFLVVAALQGLYAVTLLRWPRPPVLAFGIILNLAILALYAVSRTAGVPLFGPHAGDVEEVGSIDVVTALVEIDLVIALVTLARFRERVHVAELVPQNLDKAA